MRFIAIQSDYQNAGKRSRWFCERSEQNHRRGAAARRAAGNEVSEVEFASVYYIKFVKFAKIPIFEVQKRYVPVILKSPKFVQIIIYNRRNTKQNFVNFRWIVLL